MWYKFDGRWIRIETLRKQLEGSACWKEYEKTHGATISTLEGFLKVLKYQGMITDESEMPSVIDFLKCGQWLKAVRHYKFLFPSVSLFMCRKTVDAIGLDLFRLSEGKYGGTWEGRQGLCMLHTYDEMPTPEEEYKLFPCVRMDEDKCCALCAYLCVCNPCGCAERVEPYDTKEDQT